MAQGKKCWISLSVASPGSETMFANELELIYSEIIILIYRLNAWGTHAWLFHKVLQTLSTPL